MGLRMHAFCVPRTFACRFDNLMFDKRGRLRLVDFGVSRRVRGGVMSIGTANGAESTRAPELHREPHAANTRAADMWSAGLVLYELCNELGASPYCADAGGRPVDDWLKRVKAGVTPESVLEVKDGTTHRTVVDVMRSCLQGDPKERPSATKAFNDLISGKAALWREAVRHHSRLSVTLCSVSARKGVRALLQWAHPSSCGCVRAT